MKEFFYGLWQVIEGVIACCIIVSVIMLIDLRHQLNGMQQQLNTIEQHTNALLQANGFEGL